MVVYLSVLGLHIFRYYHMEHTNEHYRQTLYEGGSFGNKLGVNEALNS